MKKCLLSLLLAIPFLAGCNSVMIEYKNADKYVAGSQTFSEPVSKIDVDWRYGYVTLVEDPLATVTTVSEENDLKDEQKVHTYYDDGTLYVKFCKSNYLMKNIPDRKKTLLLTYNPLVLTKLIVNMTSGDFKAQSLTPVLSVDVNMTSGKAIIGSISTLSASIHQTSGDINIDTAICVHGDFRLTSGALNIKHLDVDDLTTKMTSGYIKMGFDRLGTGAVTCTSGELSFTLPTDGGKVTISKTSGTFKVHNRQYDVINGAYVIGTGDAILDINMTSGRVDIY